MEHSDWQRLKPCVALYDVQVIRVSSVAPGRFRLDTPMQSLEARVVSKDSASLRQAVTDYLARRRFRSTQRFLTNLYHERTVPVAGDEVFYLTDDWVGNPLELSREDVQSAAKNLAKLHRALDGFANHASIEHDFNAATRYGSWSNALEKGSNRISTERILARSRTRTLHDQAWYDWLGRWEEQAAAALSALHEANYHELSEAAAQNRDMAWNHYRLAGVKQDSVGRLRTMQWVDPVFDHSLYDLATLCQEICEAGHADGVVEALDGYTAERAVSPEERAMVTAFSAFPHHALGLIRQARQKGDGTALDSAWEVASARQNSAAQKLLGQGIGHKEGG